MPQYGHKIYEKNDCLQLLTDFSVPGVGNLFTRRARFKKTVDAAGRMLIGKQGEDLFFFSVITVHVRM